MRYIVACVVWTYKVRAISVKFADLTAWPSMDEYTQSEIYGECTYDFDETRQQVESKYKVQLSHPKHYFEYDEDDIEAYADDLYVRRCKVRRLNDYDNRNVTFVI